MDRDGGLVGVLNALEEVAVPKGSGWAVEAVGSWMGDRWTEKSCGGWERVA